MSVEEFVDSFGGMTESYWFYDHSVELKFDKKAHVYYRADQVDENDNLVRVDGVTTVVHILDKSHALIPWAVKKMAQKIFLTVPVTITKSGTPAIIIKQDEFDKLITEAKSAHKEILEDAGDVGHAAHDWIEKWIKVELGLLPELNQAMLYEQLEKIDPRAKSCCEAALHWMRAHNVRWISTEKKVYSLEFNYAGTMDGTALVDSCTDPKCCRLAYICTPFVDLECFRGSIQHIYHAQSESESSRVGESTEGSESEFRSGYNYSESHTDRLALIDWKSSNGLYPEYRLQTAAYQRADTEEHGTAYQERWIIRLGKEDGEFEPWHLGPEEFEHDWWAFQCCLMLTRAIKVVTERQAAQQRVVRELNKMAATAAREEANKIACPKSKDYKGSRMSKCLPDGSQCEACSARYKENHEN